MEKFIVANWKANLSLTQAEQWLNEVTANPLSGSGLSVIVAVPFPFLFELSNKFRNLSGFFWAAQDVSPFPMGSYTGSVPAAWLAGTIDYVIVGHRERRKYFRETIQDVANKVSEALEEDIRPILCVDIDSARQQSAALSSGELESVIVAYTPSDAEQLEISRGASGVAEDIEEVSALFPGAPMLYGGGVNDDNVAELFSLPQLSGVMVAGGCIDPKAFVRVLDKAAGSPGL